MNMKKTATFAFVLLLLSTVTTCFDSVSPAQVEPRIRILPDGSLDTANVPIQRNGDVYTFTDDVCAQLVVDRDNIVVDGAGYTLYGTYNGTRTDSWVVGQGSDQEYDDTMPWSIGVDLATKDRHDLTIKNLNIKNFYIGTYLYTSNNIITGCAVSDNIVGILLSGDSNIITSNYIARNEQGIFFGVNTPGDEPLNIVLTHNSFVDNDVHFSGCFCEGYNTTEAVHTWDDGEQGNYWSDYNGTDADGDGIGDTPYVIDVQNQDRYPLTELATTPPPAPPKLSTETIVVAVVLPIIIVAAIVAYYKRRQ